MNSDAVGGDLQYVRHLGPSTMNGACAVNTTSDGDECETTYNPVGVHDGL